MAGTAKETLKKARGVAESLTTRAFGTPPRRIRRGISPLWFDFKDTGADQVAFFVEICGLRRDDAVLDIGCGVGRVALPLTKYLSPRGRYEGFDILDHMIEWDRQHITTRFPNFQFQTASITTSLDERDLEASDYRFPYPDGMFDLAYAGSLFTHLTAEGVENYLAETFRTLKPGGILVSTFNLFNSESLRLLTPRSLTEIWPNDFGTYRTKEKDHPESNVAYDELYVRSLHDKIGFTLVEPIRPDASYAPTRSPKHGAAAPHLWYTGCVIAQRPR
jgi:ubiquinone/menaquinone biosynthesis C-methylase UbiE